jgi:hypothetical protein
VTVFPAHAPESRDHPAFLSAKTIESGAIIRGTGSAAARPLDPTTSTTRAGPSTEVSSEDLVGEDVDLRAYTPNCSTGSGRAKPEIALV